MDIQRTRPKAGYRWTSSGSWGGPPQTVYPYVSEEDLIRRQTWSPMVSFLATVRYVPARFEIALR